MVIYLLLYLVLAGVILFVYDLPGLWQQSREDMRQIERGELEEVVVWLSPKTRPARFPGVYSYTDHPPEPLIRYAGVSEATDGQWVLFYMPEGMDFSLDQDALYNEHESVAWNVEHSRQYQVSCTSNLRIVVSIEPLEKGHRYDLPLHSGP